MIIDFLQVIRSASAAPTAREQKLLRTMNETAVLEQMMAVPTNLVPAAIRALVSEKFLQNRFFVSYKFFLAVHGFERAAYSVIERGRSGSAGAEGKLDIIFRPNVKGMQQGVVRLAGEIFVHDNSIAKGQVCMLVCE